MKANLNTNLFPIISVSMYNTFLDSDQFFDRGQIDDDLEEGYIHFNSGYFDDNFNNGEYEKAIQERADYFLTGSHEANGIEIEIQTGNIYSPSAYNFATDQMELNVKYNKAKVKQYAKNNSEEFNDFLKQHFTSYDGFYSYTANNYEQWKEDFQNDQVQSIGAVLTFIFLDEMEGFQDGFYNCCYESLFYHEFVDTTAIDEEAKMVEDYVCKNYQDFNLEDLGALDLELLDESTVLRIAKLKMAEIDNKTLSLDLI